MTDETSPPQCSLSPCIGICRIDADGYCTGCFRTLKEIAAWSAMDNAERKRIIEQELPQRSKESE